MTENILSQLIMNPAGKSYIKADINGVLWFVYPINQMKMLGDK